jgi:hypothetical protein
MFDFDFEEEPEANKKFTEIYMRMLAPIELEPVRKRNWNFILHPNLITLTYPFSVSYELLKGLAKQITGTFEHGDQYQILGTITAPGLLGYSLKELIVPSIKGLRIKNKDELIRGGILLSKPDWENPGITNFDNKRTPDFFGGCTSMEGKKGFLELAFSDELLFCEDSPFYPANAGAHYSSAKYFLRTRKALRKELYDLVRTEGVLDLRNED